MSAVLHRYMPLVPATEGPCVFSYGGPGGALCGLWRKDDVHDVPEGVTMSSGEVPTERFELPDPTNAMGAAELPSWSQQARDNQVVERQPFSAREAVEALRDSTRSLEVGPWEVRKYLITEGSSIGPGRKGFLNCQRGLIRLSASYRVEVTPYVAGRQWAYITWGAYIELYLSEVYDQMLQDYS